MKQFSVPLVLCNILICSNWMWAILFLFLICLYFVLLFVCSFFPAKKTNKNLWLLQYLVQTKQTWVLIPLYYIINALALLFYCNLYIKVKWAMPVSVFFSPCAPGDPVSPLYECINLVQVCLVNYSHLVLFLKCCLFLVSFVRCYVYLYVLRVSPACLVLPLFWTNKYCYPELSYVSVQ